LMTVVSIGDDSGICFEIKIRSTIAPNPQEIMSRNDRLKISNSLFFLFMANSELD